MRDRGLGAGPGGQPGVLRTAGDDQHRRALEDLVLQLPGDPHPAGRHRLAVQDGQVDPALVHGLDHGRLGRALDVLERGQIGRRPLAQRQPDGFPGRTVVAVDEHLQRTL